MSCAHDNPPGYHYCAQCGQALDFVVCRCGFVARPEDHFCGGCGLYLRPGLGAPAETPARGERFALAELMAEAQRENEIVDKASVRVTQEDIRKLIELRRKKPT